MSKITDMNYQYKQRVNDTIDLKNSNGKKGSARNDFFPIHCRQVS